MRRAAGTAIEEPRDEAAEPRASSDVEAANRRLRAAYAEIAQLAGGLAHEIRNPLSTMRMNLDLLAEEFEGAETARSELETLRASIAERQPVAAAARRLEVAFWSGAGLVAGLLGVRFLLALRRGRRG